MIQGFLALLKSLLHLTIEIKMTFIVNKLKNSIFLAIKVR